MEQDNLNFDGAEWVKDAYFVKTQQDIDFIAAIDNEDYKKAEQLIKEGANVNVYTKEGETIFGVYLSLAVGRAKYCDDELEQDTSSDKKYRKYQRQYDFMEKHGGRVFTEESLQIRENYVESRGIKLFKRIANDAEFEAPVTRQMASNYSKLGQLRKKIAEGIDNKLGTHLEDVSLPTSFKERVEKPISDKVLGKLKDRDR